jgi:hypothetical protein
VLSPESLANLRPAWKVGQSGNKSGRPGGCAGLAKLIREETRDGQEMVDFALSVMRGELKAVVQIKGVAIEVGPPLSLRLEAMKWLSDRGYGKVPDVVVEDSVEAAELEDALKRVDAMSLEELEKLVRGDIELPALPRQ